MRRLLLPLILLCWTAAALGQPVAPLTSSQAQALVERTLANELRAMQDQAHPMRYRLRKFSPRLTTTKEIIETKDGAVARLISIDGKPLNQEEEQKEQVRLNALLSDPGRQRHRKQGEAEDSRRAFKVLRALPNAFLYQFAGSVSGPAGRVEKFTFRPNPKFSSPDLDMQVLASMTGELWIDAARERATRLEGHLQHDVDFGWGILGRLNKGGWIVLEQADVGEGRWRIIRFQLQMSGRVLFKTKRFDTVEEQSQFASLPAGLGYAQAIQMLRGCTGGAQPTSH